MPNGFSPVAKLVYNPPMKSISLIASLFLFALLSLIANLKFGTIDIPWHTLLRHGSAPEQQIVWVLRWPVALSAFVAGGLLALSGAILQVLLRNPLADPYILGISGGAAAFSLLAITLGLSVRWMHISGLVGALVATLLVYVLAQAARRIDRNRLLLSGVILATGWGALISLLLALSPNQTLRSMLFWLMGNVNHYSIPYGESAVLILATLYFYATAPALNLLTQGSQQAQILGLSVRAVEYQLFFCTALLTACAVNLVGTVGFIGLIVPHLLRLLGAHDHRIILPCCVLLGGSLLSLANLLSTQLVPPLQLPIGVITALIGVPAFIFLLLKK